MPSYQPMHKQGAIVLATGGGESTTPCNCLFLLGCVSNTLALCSDAGLLDYIVPQNYGYMILDANQPLDWALDAVAGSDCSVYPMLQARAASLFPTFSRG